MRRLGLVGAVLLLVGALAACQITITYSPPTSYTTIPAQGSPSSTPTATDTLAGHETVDYRVSMAAVTDALFHAEADGPVTILIMDSGGRPLVSSSTSAFFQSGLSALSVASLSGSGSGSPRTSAITFTDTCSGPCAQVAVSDSYYYVEVTNTSASSASVDLYFYGAPYGDQFETSNNSWTTTTATLNTTGNNGAIETIGDVDYWYVSVSGTWDFSATSSSIKPAVYIVDSSGNRRYGPYFSGDTIQAYAGWYYEVVSYNGYAGISQYSSYSFSNFQ